MEPQIVCPLPELAEALQPYIRSREEATKIRHVVDQALNQQHGRLDRPVTRFNTLSTDESGRNLRLNPSNGIRASYQNAVVARENAVNRLRDLRADLAALQTDGGDVVSRQPARVDETLLAISAIRQEQRQRKLQILKTALGDLEVRREKSRYADVKGVLNNDKQVLPTPPLKATQQSELREHVASNITRLKKAVVQAQDLALSDTSTLDDSRLADGDAEAVENQRLAVLTRTRDSVVNWLENELAKISEDAPSPTETFPTDLRDREHVTEQDIRNAYSGYLAARTSLIDAVDAPKGMEAAQQTDATPENIPARPSPKPTQQTPSHLSSDVLPYSADLCAITEAEAAMLQDSTFVRRQLAWSADKTQNVVRRLADESHLVAPPVADVKPWALAGREARVGDGEMVRSMLLAGENSFARAHEAA